MVLDDGVEGEEAKGVGHQGRRAEAEEGLHVAGAPVLDGEVERRPSLFVLELEGVLGRAESESEEASDDLGVAAGGGVVKDAPPLAVLLEQELVLAGAGRGQQHLYHAEDGLASPALVLVVHAGGVHEGGDAVVVHLEGGGPVPQEHLDAVGAVLPVGAGQGEGALAEEIVHHGHVAEGLPVVVVVDIGGGLAGPEQRVKGGGLVRIDAEVQEIAFRHDAGVRLDQRLQLIKVGFLEDEALDLKDTGLIDGRHACI